MKIGFITPYYPPLVKGGMEISLSLLVKALVQKGYQVKVYTLNYKNKDVFEKGNPSIYRFHWGRDMIFGRTNPLVVRKFVNRVLGTQPKIDILDAYSWFFPTEKIAKSLKIPYVLSIRDVTPLCDVRIEIEPKYHNFLDYFQLRFRRFGYHPFQLIYGLYGYYLNTQNLNMIKRAPAITCASKALVKIFKPCNKNIFSIYSIAEKKQLETHLRIKGIDFVKDRVFVYAGRLSRGKGFYECLNAAKALCQNKQIKFIFIGDGKQPFIKNSNIIFLGKVEHKKVQAIIRKSYAVVVPSQIFEAFPRLAIEAIVQAVPVIGTNVGGIPEAVGDAGIIIKPESVQAIIDACILLLVNTKKYNFLRQKTIMQAKKFSGDNISKRVLSVYNTLIEDWKITK